MIMKENFCQNPREYLIEQLQINSNNIYSRVKKIIRKTEPCDLNKSKKSYNFK